MYRAHETHGGFRPNHGNYNNSEGQFNIRTHVNTSNRMLTYTRADIFDLYKLIYLFITIFITIQQMRSEKSVQLSLVYANTT